MSEFDENSLENHDDQNHEELNQSGETGGSSDKRQKFIELAGPRVTGVLDKMRILGNLSNTSSYEYSTEQVEKIIGRLQAEVDDLKEQFAPKKKGKDTSFSL